MFAAGLITNCAISLISALKQTPQARWRGGCLLALPFYGPGLYPETRGGKKGCWVWWTVFLPSPILPSLRILSLLLPSHCFVDTFEQLSLPAFSPPSYSSKVVLLNSDDLCSPAVSVFLLQDSGYFSGADIPVILDQTWCDNLKLVKRSCESFTFYLKTLKTVGVFTCGW